MRVVSRIVVLLGLCALAGCQRHPAGAPWVDRAWVRLAPVPGRPAAAYLVVHGGAMPARLIAVESPAAGSSELHASMTGTAGMATMRPVDGIDVPTGGTVALAPGGYHLMLFGLSPQVKPGDRMALSVRFARGAPIAVEAKAIAAGDAAPY